jgi:hypothetical protein
MATIPDESTNWFLNIRTAAKEYSFCCMSKEKAMETLIEEIDRLGGDVIEAELKHPGGHVEKLPLN